MYLFFDIGATKIRAAFSESGKDFSSPKIIQTPEDFDEGMMSIKKLGDEVSKGKNIKIVVLGVPGSLDKDKTQMLISPNLSSWAGKPMSKKISDLFNGAEVFMENDTALVGLGEAAYGAGEDSKIVVYITVSTGVGGVRIVDKKIDANTWGFEPGQQIINMEEASCLDCDKRGVLEEYIGGNSITKRHGQKPEEIHDEKVWDEVSKVVAYGVNNAIVFWSPDVVVLGGSMFGSPGISIEKVRSHLSNVLKIFPEYSIIKKASLKDIGGLYGALAYINDKK